MKKILILAAIAAWTLGSCTSEEVIDPAVLGDQAIGFGTFLDRTPQASEPAIKPLGAVIDLPGLKTAGFTVLAYSTEGVAWNTYVSSAPAAPNFMDDQTVTWSTDKWEYSPIKFWPKYGSNQDGKVSFFGYSTVTGASADGKAASAPIIGFTTQAAAASQVDLTADADIDVTSTSDAGKVNFAFDHILSRIGFSAKLAAAYASAEVKVTALKVYYKANEVKSAGTYTFSATDNKAAANWTPGSTFFATGSGDNVIKSAPVTLSTAAAAINADDKYLMLIPQSDIAIGDMYVELTYTIGYTSPVLTINNTATINLPAAPAANSAWLPGKAYTYNFTLTLDPVVFDTDISVNPWENGAAPGDIAIP